MRPPSPGHPRGTARRRAPGAWPGRGGEPGPAQPPEPPGDFRHCRTKAARLRPEGSRAHTATTPCPRIPSPPARGSVRSPPPPAPRPHSQGVREGAESRGHGGQPPAGAVHSSVPVAAAGGRAGRGGGPSAGPSGRAPRAPCDEAEQSEEAPHRRPPPPARPPRHGTARHAAKTRE